MEQAAIVEGFQCSLKMHNVRYSHLVADGDSSVYKKILEADPYGAVCKVQKVACKNHLLRCFRRNLDKYCSSSSNKFQPLVDSKRLIRARIMRLSNSIDAACKFRASEKQQNAITLLREDIINAPYHVFGSHENCAAYFCKNDNSNKQQNLLPELQKTEAFDKLKELILRLANNSDSLILNENNNKVESFNSIMCKTVAGKRINYTGSSGYHGRSALSVLLFNRQPPISLLHRTICPGKPPGCVTSKNETSWLKRRDRNKEEKVNAKRRLFAKSSNEDYGLSEEPDLEPEIYIEKVDEFMRDISLTDEEREQLEFETRGQSDCSIWKEERRKRITASNFGTICKMGLNTSTANTVRSMVATTFKGTAATEYGKSMETRARQKLSTEIDAEVQECGLVLHPTYPFLGASPDGLVGNDQVVEIKCPTIFASKSEEESEAAYLNGEIKWLDHNGNLKKTHAYFYQVQGQLEITNWDIALFVIYSPNFIRILEIERDQMFWNTKMLPRLISFYNNCLLPELVDSRLERQRPLRAINYEGDPVISKKPISVQVVQEEKDLPNDGLDEED